MSSKSTNKTVVTFVTRGLRAKKRREEIAEAIKRFGIGVSQTQLAKKHGVSQQMVSKDIKKIIAAWPAIDVKEKHIDIGNALQEALRIARLKMYMVPKDGGDAYEADRMQLQGARAVSSICKDFTAMMESWGDKDKVANPLQLGIQDESATKKIIAELLREDETDDELLPTH